MKIAVNKWAMVALFILAVIVKAILLRTYLIIDSDRSLQLVAAAQLAKGLGYTVPQVDLLSMNTVQNMVLLEWPPLYSVLTAGLLRLTQFDFVLSSAWMDSLGAFLYLLGIWRLAACLRFTPVLQMIIVWFKATEFYEGFLASFPTDFLAAACWIWAFYFFLEYLDAPKKKWIVGLIIAIGASFLFRYVYLTALPVLPFLLWWNGHIKNRRDWKKAAIVTALFIAAIVLAYLGFNKMQSGSYTYLEQWDKGFYPEKLLNIVPLFWQAFGHVTFIGVQLELLLHLPYRWYQVFLQLSSLLIITSMLIRWKATKKITELSEKDNRFSRFLVPAVWVSLAIIGTLTILSLRIDFPKNALGNTWSYLVEDRYFLVPLTVILFVLAGKLYMQAWKQARLQKILQVALLLAFFVQVIHTGWILQKRIPLIAKEDAGSPADPEGKRISLLSLFQEGRQRGDDVVLLSKEYGYTYFALGHNVKVCRQVNALQDTTVLGVKQPTTIVVSVDEIAYRKHKIFFDRNHFELRQRYQEELHLIAHLQPGKP